MKIDLLASGIVLCPKSIAGIEAISGFPLPLSYRDFLNKFNGARPSSNVFYSGEKKLQANVEVFFGCTERRGDDLQKQLDFYSGRLPEGCLPVAEVGGGNLLCIVESGQVYVWDHEQEAGEGEKVGMQNMMLAASSFAEFMERLLPFDPTEIELDPKQVKKVAVDPEFLKSRK